MIRLVPWLALLTLIAAGAHSVRGVHAAQPVALTPVADTWRLDPPPDASPAPPAQPTEKPPGSSTTLEAGWHHQHGTQRTLLRFALPDDVGAEQLEQAQLRVHVRRVDLVTYRQPAFVETMHLLVQPVGRSWSEAEADLELPPPSQATVRGSHPIPGVGSGSGAAYVTVTELVRRWLSVPGSNHGLVLDADDGGAEGVFGVVFTVASRESRNAPLLQLQWRDEVPSPAPSAAPTARGSTPEPSPSRLFLPQLGRTG